MDERKRERFRSTFGSVERKRRDELITLHNDGGNRKKGLWQPGGFPRNAGKRLFAAILPLATRPKNAHCMLQAPSPTQPETIEMHPILSSHISEENSVIDSLDAKTDGTFPNSLSTWTLLSPANFKTNFTR